MTPQELVKELRQVGYNLHLDGENIRFRYLSEGELPKETSFQGFRSVYEWA